MHKATGAEGRRLRSAGSSRPALASAGAPGAAGPGAVPACRRRCRSEAGEAVRIAARGAQGCVHSVMQAESCRRVRRCVNSVRHARHCERSEGRGAAQELICTCLVAAADSALSAAEVEDPSEVCSKPVEACSMVQ